MSAKIRFVTLLALYIIIVLLVETGALTGDEDGYVMFAKNLSQGYYSPKGEINLHWGPGYPMVLLSFVLLKIPWLAAKLLNAVFLYLGINYFYKTLRLFLEEKPSFYLSFILGIYPPLFRDLPFLQAEAFVFLLICGFMYHFCKMRKNERSRGIQLIIASFYLGYLALTKIFFGYVILVSLAIYLLLTLWKRKTVYIESLIIYILALVFCLPYLFYTYSLTGKFFYWGSSGGESLYWMSSPYKNDLGSWHSEQEVAENPELYKNHHLLFERLLKLDRVRRDEEFKKKAVQNIRKAPQKFFYNWMCNVGRLLFSYPFSYARHSLTTFFYLLPNMFIFVLAVLCLYPSYLGRRLIPSEIYVLVFFGIVSFVGTSLLSAFDRQFRPLIPIFLLWMIFVLFHIVKIEIFRSK